MRSPFDLFRKRDFAIERLKTADAVAIAGLHTDGFHRPWNDGEFRSLLAQGPVFGFIARPVGRADAPAGFVLARLVAGEAEILTVAVSKPNRRSGLGRKLMDAVLRQLHAQRAQVLILEVDEQNSPAIGLYKKLGFLEVAKRPSYYQTADGRSSALVMRLELK
ncbi:MAG: N-acetyltransferase [Rhizobiaceae bacterium]